MIQKNKRGFCFYKKTSYLCNVTYNSEHKLRAFIGFAGLDAQLLALERLKRNTDFDYECVGWSEIDKYAIKAHNALFPDLESKNYGDICKINWSQVPDFDLFTMSSPCTDFSAAGKRMGGVKRIAEHARPYYGSAERRYWRRNPNTYSLRMSRICCRRTFSPAFRSGRWNLRATAIGIL